MFSNVIIISLSLFLIVFVRSCRFGAPNSGSDGSSENKGKGRREREIERERREHDVKTK